MAGEGTILRKLTILATLGQAAVWWSSWTLDVAHTNVCVLGALKETKRIIGGSPSEPGGPAGLSEEVLCKPQLKGKKAPATMSHTGNVRSERWAGLGHF